MCFVNIDIRILVCFRSPLSISWFPFSSRWGGGTPPSLTLPPLGNSCLEQGLRPWYWQFTPPLPPNPGSATAVQTTCILVTEHIVELWRFIQNHNHAINANQVRTSVMALHKFTLISWACLNVASLTQSYHSRAGQNGGTYNTATRGRLFKDIASLQSNARVTQTSCN